MLINSPDCFTHLFSWYRLLVGCVGGDFSQTTLHAPTVHTSTDRSSVQVCTRLNFQSRPGTGRPAHIMAWPGPLIKVICTTKPRPFISRLGPARSCVVIMIIAMHYANWNTA